MQRGSLLIIETNSEDGSDSETVQIVHLRQQLQRNKHLLKEAVQSCEHYKRINENLLSAMTQMSLEKNIGYEAVLERERQQQIEKQRKDIIEANKIAAFKLEAEQKRAANLDRIKADLEAQLKKSRQECANKMHIITGLTHQLEELRAESARKSARNSGFLAHDSQNSNNEMIEQLQYQTQTLSRLNRQLSEDARLCVDRMNKEHLSVVEAEKKTFESKLESLIFENKILQKECEQLTKDNNTLKKQLQQAQKIAQSEREQQDAKWYVINQKLLESLQKAEEKATQKQKQHKMAMRDATAYKVKFEQQKQALHDSEARINELQGLLGEAKFHILNFDLENKNLEIKMKSQHRCLRQETQKLRKELGAAKKSEEIRARVLDSLIEKQARSARSKSKTNPNISQQSSTEIEKSLLEKSSLLLKSNENDANFSNLLLSCQSGKSKVQQASNASQKQRKLSQDQPKSSCKHVNSFR